MSQIVWKKANTGILYSYSTAYSPDLNRYVNVGESLNNTYFSISNDGYKWKNTLVTGITPDKYDYIIYSNKQKLFITLAYGKYIIYSKDGIHWKQSTVPSTYYFGFGAGLVYSEEKDLFVSTGSNYPDNTIAQIITSKDGITWSDPIQIPELSNLRNVIYSSEKGLFVTCGSPGAAKNIKKNGIVISKDGYNWTVTYTNTEVVIFSVVYGNGQFIAFGNTNFDFLTPEKPKKPTKLVYATSTDGYNWSTFQSLMGLENYLVSYPTYSQEYNMFAICTFDVAIKVNKQNERQPCIVYTSEDGVNWTKSLEMPTGQSSEWLYFVNGKFFVGGGTIKVDDLFESNGSFIYTGDYVSDICLIKGTPINTDQGIVPIEIIVPGTHTINNTAIVKVTNTLSSERSFVCFEQHSLGINCPTQRTIMTPGHKVLYKGKLVEAKHFIGRVEGVHSVENSGESVYNVLQRTHGTMKVNGMVLETLHPENRIAKNIL